MGRSVELQAPETYRVYGKGPDLTHYTIGRKRYAPPDIWHEVGYRPSGWPIGINRRSGKSRSRGQNLNPSIAHRANT